MRTYFAIVAALTFAIVLAFWVVDKPPVAQPHMPHPTLPTDGAVLGSKLSELNENDRVLVREPIVVPAASREALPPEQLRGRVVVLETQSPIQGAEGNVEFLAMYCPVRRGLD